MQNSKHIASTIGSDDYARSRLNPRPGNGYYLHLLDLVAALRQVIPSKPLRLLDFGCGSSPYRSLFPSAEYVRADYLPSEGIDYVIGEDQLIPTSAASFDLVLSTQVLEHVKNPALYLAECYRVLKPGGMLILTTHGLFEDHGCPYDFRRWTADGLTYELTSASFKVEEMKKLTTNGRAIAFIFHQYAGFFMGSRRREPLAFLHWLLFRTNKACLSFFDRWCARRFSASAVVEAAAPGHILYVALLAVARRPE